MGGREWEKIGGKEERKWKGKEMEKKKREKNGRRNEGVVVCVKKNNGGKSWEMERSWGCFGRE